MNKLENIYIPLFNGDSRNLSAMDFILDTEVPLPEDLAVIHSFSSPVLSDIEKPTNILNLENLLNVVNETVETSEKKSLAVNEELNLPSTITPCIASLKDNFFVELHNFESINNLSSNGTVNDVALSRNIMPMNCEENFQTESINFDTSKVSTSDFGVIHIDESSKLQFENPPMVKINYSKRKPITEENSQCTSGEMLISMFNGYEMKELDEQKVIRFTGTCIQAVQDALEETDFSVNEMDRHQTTNIVQIPEYDVHQHLNVQRKESAMLSLANCPSLQSFSKNIAFLEKNRGEKLESNNNFIANKIDFPDNYERKFEKSVELDEIEDDQKRNLEEIQNIKNNVESIDETFSDSQFKKMCLTDKDHSSTNVVLPADLNNSKNNLNSIKINNELNPLKIKQCKVLVKKLEPQRKKRSAFLHQTLQSNDSNYYNLSKDVNSSTEYKRIPVIRLSRIRKKNVKGKKQNYKLKEKTRKKTSKSQKHSLDSDTSLSSRQKESLRTYIHLYNSQSNYDPEMDVNMKKFKAKNFHTKTKNFKKRRSDCNAEYHKAQKVAFDGDGELLRKKVTEAKNIKRQNETYSDSAIKVSGNDVEQISELSESKLLRHLPKQKRKRKESHITITKPPKNLSKSIGKRSKVQVLKSNAYSFVNRDIMNGSEKNKLNEQIVEFNEISTKKLKEKELLNNYAHHSEFPEKTVKCNEFLDCDDKFSHGKTTFHTNLSEFTSDVRSKITFNESNPLSVIKPCRIMLKKLEHHICKMYLRESNSSLCKTLSSETNTFPMFDNLTQHNIDKHKTFCQRKLKNFKTKPRKKFFPVVKKRSKKDVIAKLKEKSKKKSTRKTKKDLILRKNKKVYIDCKKRSLTFDDKREFLNNQSEKSLHETEFMENMTLESNDKQKSSKIAIKGNNTSKIVDSMNVLNEKSEESPIFSDHKVLHINDLGESNHEAKLTEQKQKSNSEESYSKITIEKTNKISMSEINPKCEVDSDDCSDHSDNSEWYVVVSDADENEVSEENDTDLKESEVDKNLVGGKNNEIQMPNILNSVTFELNDNESREMTLLTPIKHCSSEKKSPKKRIHNSDLNDCALVYENDSNRSSENGVEKQVLISDKISFEKLKESKISVFPIDPIQNITKEPSEGNNGRKEIENNTESTDSSQIRLPQMSGKCKKMETENVKNVQNLIKLHASLHQGSQIPDNKHFDANEDPISIDSGNILMPNITESLPVGFKKNKFKKCSCYERKKWSLSNEKCTKLHKSKFTTGLDENSFSVRMKCKWKQSSNSNANDMNQSFEDEHVMESLGNRINGLEMDDKVKSKVDLLSSTSVNCNESSRNRPSKFVLNHLDNSFVTKQCSVLLDRLDSEVVKIYTMNQKFLLHQKSQSYRNSHSKLDKFKDLETLSKSFSPAKFGKKFSQKKCLSIKKSFKKLNSLSERKIENTKFTRKCNLRMRVNHNHTKVKKSELVEGYRKSIKGQQKRRQMKREKAKMHVIVNESNSFRKKAQRNYLKKLKFLFHLKSCRVLVQRCDSSSFTKNLDGNVNEIYQKLQIDSSMFDSTDSEDDEPFNSKFSDVSDSKFYPTSCSKYCEISDSECSNLSGKLSAASNGLTDCVDDDSYFRKTPYRMRKKSNEDNLTDDELKQVSNKKEFKNLSCNVCDKSFIAYTSFLNHERKFHRNKAYKCVLCNKSFKPRGIFLKHMRNYHPETKPFICDFMKCEESFSTENQLINHQNCHANFFCRFCKKGFVLKTQMFQHISKWH